MSLSRSEAAASLRGPMLPESHDAEIPSGRDPYAAFRFGGYRNYFIGGFISVIGRQMLAVAIGWEI